MAGLRQVELYGPVEPPALELEDVHPVAEDFYHALLISGQTRCYEPSDWQRARVFVKVLSDQLKAGKPSSMMYAALQEPADRYPSTAAMHRKCGRLVVAPQTGVAGALHISGRGRP